MSAAWLTDAIERLRRHAKAGRLRLTRKARAELLELDLGLDDTDVRDVLAQLEEGDFVERVSSVPTKEWLFVFKPVVARTRVYVKLLLREGCVVVSFHADEGER